VWTLEARGELDAAALREAELAAGGLTVFERAVPSYTHAALVALARAGRVAGVVSQNVDGLHVVSGLPREQLAELHGNLFVEACDACGHEAVRPFEIRSVGCRPTGRRCDRCGGPYRDTALDWDQPLPPRHLKRADAWTARCDLSLCLGTSLQMEPATALAVRCARRRKASRGRVVIVNLQPTRVDRLAALMIRAPVDTVMRLVMRRLALPLPYTAFTRSAEGQVGVVRTGRQRASVRLRGADGAGPCRGVGEVAVHLAADTAPPGQPVWRGPLYDPARPATGEVADVDLSRWADTGAVAVVVLTRAGETTVLARVAVPAWPVPDDVEAGDRPKRARRMHRDSFPTATAPFTVPLHTIHYDDV